ncbi:MAG: translation initiation factor IF-2 [Chloroherpetonaceae bacterium]|nr:translation initiation factor IF-2 [Chloroherpetonaceae bacterium]
MSEDNKTVEEKKYKVADIAEELAISAQDLIAFLGQNGIKVASASTKVGESARALILEHFSDAKKQSDANRKLKAEKEKKKKALEARVETPIKESRPRVAVAKPKPEPAPPPAPEPPREIPAPTTASEPVPEIAPEPAVAAAADKVAEAVSEKAVTETVADETAAQSVVQAELAIVATPVNGEAAYQVTQETKSEPVATTPSETTATPAAQLEEKPQPKEQDASENLPAETIIPTADVAQVEASEPTRASEQSSEEPVAVATALTGSLSEELVQKTEPDTRTELQREIERQQAEIASKFAVAENVGGLRVLGEIDLFKKKKKKEKKKRFGEQARDLREQSKLTESTTPKAAPVPSSAPKAQPAPKPIEAKKTQPPPPVPPRQQEVYSTEPPAKPSKKEAVADAEEKLEGRGKKRHKRHEIDEKIIERNIRETMLGEVGEVASRQKFRKQRRREREEKMELEAAQRAAEDKIVKVTEFATTHEFADLLGVTPKEVIEKCFRMGKLITINQRLDRETMELLALEFGREIQFISDVEATQAQTEEDRPEDLAKRPPVVTIMGHVDHGKTSLLDYIRQSNIVAGEAGGITQHIGAYEVTLENGEKITFLDTPGHEAFTAMRARGVQVTDIVILVVAADDNVMPQTVEAINHAKAAGVPIVVAINKIDKPEANPDKIRAQLAENGVVVEEWGGEVQCQEISAKKGIGVRQLLDKVLAQADLMNLKANYNPNRLAKGVVIEAELDKGKGAVATVLVQTGLLRVGAPFVAGLVYGRVRAMLDERGRRVEEAHPSQPVRVLGFEGLPEAGDVFNVMPSDREAREIATRRQLIRREQLLRQATRVKLNEISKQAQSGQVKTLRIVLKADTGGSIEALSDGLMKIQTNEVNVEIIHKGVGQITESDVLLAAASDAIIIGFRVRPNLNAKRLAEQENIDIRFYSVIYHALEEVKDALEGMLSPEVSEKLVGMAEVREVFRISKVGNVAGCYVLEGKIRRDARVRLLRDGVQIYEGELSSLKRFKDDVKEVETGFECGLTLSGYDDIKVGDVIEIFETVETKRKLTVE